MRLTKLRPVALVAAVAVSILAGCTQLLGLDLDAKHGAAADAAVDGQSGEAGAPLLGPSPFAIVQQLPQGAMLNAIWGADRDHVFAVGADAVAYVYTSGTWTKFGGNEIGRDFHGVWGSSPSNVFAVGASNAGGGFIRHYDGAGWSEVLMTADGLNGVWGTADGFVLAVGDEGGLYAWHAKDEWRSFGPLPPNPDRPAGDEDPILWSISGRTFDDFAIASSGGRIFHSELVEGTQQFVTYDTVVDKALAFRTLWQGPGAATNLFVGTNYFGILGLTVSSPTPGSSTTVTYALPLLFRDDTTPNGATSFIRGIWGTAARVIAVGDLGRIYTYQTKTGDVIPIGSPVSGPLSGVWGSSLEDVWIVGEDELILHGSLAP